ncbi:MAG: hypothetical protein C0615_07760 [Desulfuromonas sp.]|nr:MAG: hypothetical protein C0615_07760 [Desulfuromonas sp.]
MNFSIATDKEGFQVTAAAQLLGDDLLVTCTGGDKPHIGAVAVAYPRPSINDPEKLSASANVICLSGHREDELARSAALKLCRAIGRTVTVVAGMHWDKIDAQGIRQVVANVEELIDRLCNELTYRMGGKDGEA